MGGGGSHPLHPPSRSAPETIDCNKINIDIDIANE